nr:peroxisomal fatty acid beta-oxidation multifunctional protein AIM1-like [Tanacetum cinerariifolium]
MAISVISVSSDSSEESVGPLVGRVILFGTIPTTILDTTPAIIPPTTQTDTTVIPTKIPIIAPTIPPSSDYTLASPDYSHTSDTIHLRIHHQTIYRHYQLSHHFYHQSMTPQTDLVGYGVVVAILKEFTNAFPDRTFRSPIVNLLIKSRRNGKNSGKGYYLYEKGSKPKPDPQVFPIIEETKRQVNIMPGGK